MNTIHNHRMHLILIILLGVSVAVGLTLYALRQNISLFYTPSQIYAGDAPARHDFRLGGMVRKNSVRHAQQGLKVSFVLTDYQHETRVEYDGILPDLFREGQGVVTQGRLNAQGVFVASQVLAKHDEKYMPPQLQRSLRKV